MNALRKAVLTLFFRARFRGQYLAAAVGRGLSRWEQGARALLFLGVTLGIAAFINFSEDPHRDTGEATTGILIAMGSLFGGVLAIVFALSTFMQQGAADLYSSQFYNVYVHDWREKIVFGLIALLTIGSFALAVFQSTAANPLGASALVYVILLMAAGVLSLVDWQYKLVTRKVNPLMAVSFLEAQCLESVAKANKFAKAVASWLRIHDETLDEDAALAVSYSRFVTPHLAHVDQQLEYMMEISLKLASKGELMATKRGLTAVHNVVAKYLEFRRDSSLAMPAGPYWMATESDSQSFLARNFERINTAAETLMTRGQSQSVVFIMDLYASLAERSKEVQFLNRPGENPVLDQLRGYASGLLDAAIRRNDLEVCFRSIEVFKAVGSAAVDRKLRATTLYGVYGHLAKVATWAITSKRPELVEYSTAPVVTLVARSVQEDVPGLESQMAEGLQRLQAITLTMQTAVSTGFIPTNTQSQFMVGKCYEQLDTAFQILVQQYNSLPEGRARTTFASNLLRLCDDLYRSLRQMSELLKNCDAPVAFNIASLIEEVLTNLVNLSIDEKDIGKRQDFEKQLSWYTHLPFWFVEHAGSFTSTHAFDTLADIAPRTGLLLLHRDARPDPVRDCARSAFSVTKLMLRKVKGGHAYDEPRHMLTICYLGVVALKQGQIEIVREIAQMVYEFEKLYRERYFSEWTPPEGAYMGPRPDQLFHEVLRWRADVIRERYNFVPPMGDSRSIVGQLVDDVDIDRFICEVWESVPADSRVQEELAQTLQLRWARTRLVRILKAELAKRQEAGSQSE